MENYPEKETSLKKESSFFTTQRECIRYYFAIWRVTNIPALNPSLLTRLCLKSVIGNWYFVSY